MSAAQPSDAAAGLDTSGGVLAEIEAQLRAPDSILEPGVLDLLKEYLRAGGKPQSAIEDLSENYAGVFAAYAALAVCQGYQSCNEACSMPPWPLELGYSS